MKIVFASVLVAILSFIPKEQECDQLKFDIHVVHTSSGLDNGKIEVSKIDSPSKVRAFLYGDNKSKNRLDVKVEKLIKLPAGTYILILQNSQCSSVTHDIIVK